MTFVSGLTAVVLASLAALLASAADATVPAEPRERVAHHVRAVDELAQHFQTVMATPCPRFPSRAGWETYIDGEIERVVLLLAHLEQAWLEAKRTPDDDVRREAKAPRKRIDEARGLVGKLQQCADDHGAGLAPLSLWRRIERDVPRKQAQIALPLPH